MRSACCHTIRRGERLRSWCAVARPALYAAGTAGVYSRRPPERIDHGEDAESSARREAMEETGIRLRALEPVAAVWSMPGVSTERLSTVSRRLQRGRSHRRRRRRCDGEDIEVIEMPLAEACRDGGFRHAFTDMKTCC